MKRTEKKSRPDAVTSERRFQENSKNDCRDMIAQAALPVKPCGVFTDPLDRWPAMPVYDMPEETPESWNAKAARQRRERELFELWTAETSDPESEEWREELTDQEAAMVAEWDEGYITGMLCLIECILKGEAGNGGGSDKRGAVRSDPREGAV